MDDCGDCKEKDFMLFIYPTDKQFGILKTILIEHLNFTDKQVDILLRHKEEIKKHPILIDSKKVILNRVDLFSSKGIDTEVTHKQKMIFK